MMKVELIAITKPEGKFSHMTAEELIVAVARVSNPSNQQNTETSAKLINYCIKHGHWSIFEQASMTVEVTTSRAISAQIIRHKHKVQEFSQRYSEATEFEEFELRKQGKTNRQVGDESFDPAVTGGGATASMEIDNLLLHSKYLYNNLIKAGVAKESARMILPMCTQTTLYLTNDVRGWLAYFNQRLASHTQKEHREVARAIADIFEETFPIITEATDWFNKGQGNFM